MGKEELIRLATQQAYESAKSDIEILKQQTALAGRTSFLYQHGNEGVLTMLRRDLAAKQFKANIINSGRTLQVSF